MKNLKVVISLLPVLILTCFIYFSTIGFSTAEEGPAAKADKRPTNTVMLYIILTDTDGNHCLGGSYEYCINGGHPQNVFTEGFYAEVPCGEPFTICVTSGKCSGIWTGTASCNVDTFITVNLSPDGRPCSCN